MTTSSSDLSTPTVNAEGPGTVKAQRWPAKARRWPWVVAGLGLLALLLYRSARGGGEGAKTPAGGRAVPVVAVAARSGDMAVHLTGLGTAAALNTVTVRSRVDGQITQVAFREGQFVKQGDLLVEIDPRPFQVQLAQAEGQLAKDEAALRNAQLDLSRFQALVQQGILSRQQVDAQGTTVSQYLAAVKSDQGQVDSAKLNLTYSRVAAPISGKVGLRLVDLGNLVRANDPNGLLTITQVQPITVLFTIPADQIPQVAARMRGGPALVAEAFDRDLKARLAVGALVALDNQIDPATGTLRLRAEFPNDDNALFPNQFVNVRLKVDTLKGAVLVPAAAIQRSPASTFVYVVRPDTTVELRPVEIQASDAADAALRSGLAAGEKVVVDGVDKLRPGIKVEVTGEGQGSAKGAK